MSLFFSVFILAMLLPLISLLLAIAKMFSFALAKRVRLTHMLGLLVVNLSLVAIQQFIVDPSTNIRIDLIFVAIGMVMQLFSILLFKVYEGERA